MTPMALVSRIASMGGSVHIIDGYLKVIAPPGRVTQELLNGLRSHKAEIIQLLQVKETAHGSGVVTPDRQMPNWCDHNCRHLEVVELPGEMAVAGCLQNQADFEQWTRLDWLWQCPRRITGQGQAWGIIDHHTEGCR